MGVFKKFSFLAAALTAASICRADLLVNYNAGDNTNGFAEGGITKTGEANYQNTSIIAIDMGVSAAQDLLYIEPPAFAGLGTSPDNAFMTTNWNAGGITRYWEFGFTVTDGLSIQLESIQFDERSFSGPTIFGIRYSGDNFNANLYTANPTAFAWGGHNADLSGSTVLINTTVTFRIFGQSAPVGNGQWQIDNVQITGIYVPEPATMGLTALGLLSTICYRRRRNKL